MERSFEVNHQMEVLHSKYLGCGNSDTTQQEWMLHQHRDSLATYLSNIDMLVYFSYVENKSLARQRLDLLNKMATPIRKKDKCMPK